MSEPRVEIDGHKFAVEVIDGQRFVRGVVLDGVQLPNPAKLPAGIAVIVDASASIELSTAAAQSILTGA